MKRHVSIAATVLLLAILGCGGSGLSAVHGTVTLDGKPLERGRIEFEPADGKGPLAAADIVDGRYEAPVMPGKKTVRITGGKVVGRHPFTEDPASPMVEDIKSLVPESYNARGTLECEVTRRQATYDFELKSTAR
jgi:hypothetical protein